MEIVCLGSGSSGNAYIIKDNDATLLLECGFEFSKLVKKLHRNNIAITDIDACAITHYHSDHSKASELLEKYNILIVHKNTLIHSQFSIHNFPLCHDVEAYGFVITFTQSHNKILFINDTSCCNLPNDVIKSKYDYVMIECNHTRRKLKELMENAEQENMEKYQRQHDFHLSLAGTKKMLSALDLSQTKAIYLMHLSQEASEPEVMKTVIESTFNIKTYVCKKEGDFQ